jgi:biopolymer transport protein ExbB/TolQ
MTKQKVIYACMIVFVFPLILTGCYNVERARLEAKLEQTERERDDFRTRLAAVERSPEQSSEAPVAPGELQQQIDEFIKVRDALRQREEELAKLRQVALDEAQTARTLMDKLAAQLETETKKVNAVQNQLQQAQQAIAELQDEFKQ